MPRGGARPGSGPKKKPAVPTSAATPAERRRSKALYEALVRPAKDTDSEEVKAWRQIVNRDPSYLWKMFEHAEGRAVHIIENHHLHDTPLDMTVTVKISEVIRGVRQRKQDYERSRS